MCAPISGGCRPEFSGWLPQTCFVASSVRRGSRSAGSAGSPAKRDQSPARIGPLIRPHPPPFSAPLFGGRSIPAVSLQGWPVGSSCELPTRHGGFSRPYRYFPQRRRCSDPHQWERPFARRWTTHPGRFRRGSARHAPPRYEYPAPSFDDRPQTFERGRALGPTTHTQMPSGRGLNSNRLRKNS